jgi:hypothetical protein
MRWLSSVDCWGLGLTARLTALLSAVRRLLSADACLTLPMPARLLAMRSSYCVSDSPGRESHPFLLPVNLSRSSAALVGRGALLRLRLARLWGGASAGLFLSDRSRPRPLDLSPGISTVAGPTVESVGTPAAPSGP